jgi:hypothetical protein
MSWGTSLLNYFPYQCPSVCLLPLRGTSFLWPCVVCCAHIPGRGTVLTLSPLVLAFCVSQHNKRRNELAEGQGLDWVGPW